MNKNPGTISNKKQPWGPFFKQVLGPNVPWVWYIANFLSTMIGADIGITTYQISAQIMAGEIFDNSLLTKYFTLSCLSLVLSLARGFSGGWANYYTERKLQRRVWTRMVHMPMRLYDRQNPSTLISRVTHDTTLITQLISGAFDLLTTIYVLYVMLAQIWGMDRRITLALLCVLPYIWLVMFVPGRFKFNAQKAMQKKLAELGAFIAERLNSMTLVKSAANEDKDLEVGYQAAEDYYKAQLKYDLIHGASQPFTYSVEGIVGAIVLISGSILLQQSKIDMTQLLTMFMYSQSLWVYMIAFIFYFHDLKDAQGATSKIAEIMAADSEELKREKSFTQPDSDITFEDVSFRYTEQTVLDRVDLVIPKGKVTAIVGPSGAGKTTLLSLLERLYTPNGGQLTFGGTPVEKFHLDQWRRATGYIQQASPLRSGTIRDNITYGLVREATEEQVVQAAKAANAYDFIMKLPQGFDTDIGQLGGNLSGGERQRIAIARMIIMEPDYLFLDEATSNLDAENEAAVQTALAQIMKGKTAVIVAHNLRTVVNADNIVVMEQGRVQAVGTHESLYKTNALYTKYFDLQFTQ